MLDLHSQPTLSLKFSDSRLWLHGLDWKRLALGTRPLAMILIHVLVVPHQRNQRNAPPLPLNVLLPLLPLPPHSSLSQLLWMLRIWRKILRPLTQSYSLLSLLLTRLKLSTN